nr:NADH dehydrogenase subunit 5 [Renocera pallida]
MQKSFICIFSSIWLFTFSLLLLITGLILLMKNLSILLEWGIIEFHSSEVVMSILIDWMSALFMSFVLLISSMVITYSAEYMKGDKTLDRFILLVLMFVFSMMLLIISPNLISILLGWDGLGLVSYCLVIYFQNEKSYSAGMLTALSNRVGDVALLMAIAWMLGFGSWSFYFYLDFMKNFFDMQVIGGLVMIAALTKSAQIPFSSWLPAAMAAPTPVSALVHSSTLVTAGVYLMIRFNVVISNSYLGTALLLLGGLTMFMAGLGANFETDLKKIIALSTLSQLGLMMSVLSLGYSNLAFFHLLMHALFKALLFLCAGSIIHMMHNFQDIRFMGSLITNAPLTLSCMNVANLALCGMPFLAGFYSSDLILEMVMMGSLNMFSFFLFFFSTGLTVAYSFRLSFYMTTSSSKSFPLVESESSFSLMAIGMVVLTFFSVVGGSLFMWLIFPSLPTICLPLTLKLLTMFTCLIGGVWGYYFSISSKYSESYSIKLFDVTNFVGSMWFIPFISTYGIVKFPLQTGMKLVKVMDQGWSEQLGGQAIMFSLENLSKKETIFQFNSFKLLITSFVFWTFLILWIFITLE